MKKFLRCVIEWKISTCIAFTASVLIYMAIAFFMGEKALPFSTMFSLLLLSAVGSFLQYLCFADRILHCLRYSLRLLLFTVLFLPVVAGCAWLFNWLPKENPYAWLTMLLIFLAVLIVMTVGFEIYFWLVGKRYDGLLGEYKRKHENNP